MRFIILSIFLFSASIYAEEIVKLRPAIKDAAKEHQVDPILMEAIIRHESGHGKSKAAKHKNNLAGIMRKGKLKTFSSKEDCIKQLAETLAIYKKNGHTTVKAIGKKYASNSKWPNAVNQHIKDIKNGKHGEVTE